MERLLSGTWLVTEHLLYTQVLPIFLLIALLYYLLKLGHSFIHREGLFLLASWVVHKISTLSEISFVVSTVCRIQFQLQYCNRWEVSFQYLASPAPLSFL